MSQPSTNLPPWIGGLAARGRYTLHFGGVTSRGEALVSRLLLAGGLIVGCGTAGWAQTETPGQYTMDVYMGLQSRADASYELMQSVEPGTPMRNELAEVALSDRADLARYLGSWSNSGELPADMVESAYETRIVLLQNIVTLRSELGRCAEAREGAARMEALVEERTVSELSDDAVLFAWREVARCDGEEQPELTEPSGEVGTESTDTEGAETSEGTEASEVVLTAQPEDPVVPEDSVVVDDTALGRTTSVRPEWYVLSGGVLLTLAGGYVARVAMANTADDIVAWNARVGAGEEALDNTRADELENRGRTQGVMAAAFLGTGLIAIAGGTVWHFTRGDDQDDASGTLTVTIAPGLDGGTIQTRWAW